MPRMSNKPQVEVAPGFGQRLRQLRHTRLETQAEFALALGVGESRVCEWETEYQSPSLGTLKKIVAQTGVRIEWLAWGKE